MSVKTKPSLENLVESGVLGVESLHPGGMTTTKELAELCRVSENKLLLDFQEIALNCTSLMLKNTWMIKQKKI